MPSRNSLAGYTLIELMATLVLFALLAGMASASWNTVIGLNRHRDMVNEVQLMFAVARSYATNHRGLTTLCPLSQAQKCVDDWTLPVGIFTDRDNDKRPDDGRIHRVFQPVSQNSSIASRTAGRGYFQLASDGMSHGTLGSLIVCTPVPDAAPHLTYIALNMGGRIRVLNDTDGDGRIKLPWGPVLTCPAR
ncbi:GspH/FimT family pseudopilin [Marinobacter sp.]|uniref:GspH/FimT family pseudopilin n=1 Tax=Marinobacter sp. TaxID=50741 RepID=UPI0035C68CA6|nr:GspH/FimT family pseudopilin [Oleiphilaceae bacterium]